MTTDPTLALEARLRDGLEKTAPADWKEITYDNDTGPGDEGYWEWWSVGGGRFDDEDDAKYAFACSPDNIRQLLDALATLRRERDEARAERDVACRTYEIVSSERDTLRQRLEQVERERDGEIAVSEAGEIERLKWRERAMSDRALLAETGKVLEPFADVDGEGDEDFPDDTPVHTKFGRTDDFTLVLGDFRKARALATKIAEQANER